MKLFSWLKRKEEPKTIWDESPEFRWAQAIKILAKLMTLAEEGKDWEAVREAIGKEHPMLVDRAFHMLIFHVARKTYQRDTKASDR
jgi:hypothetical protein